MALYYHAGLDRVTEGPETARASLAQSGWEPLSEEKAEEYYAQQRRDAEALEEETAGRVELDPSVAPVDVAPEGDSLADESADTTTEKGK